MSAEQLVFELDERVALGREDFFVGPCNAAAVGWLDRWPDWPNRGLVIFGPPACGKTHLVRVWQATTGGRLLEGRSLCVTDPPELAGLPVAIEACDAPIDEEALVHLYNLQQEAGGSLLLTGRTPPRQWGIGMPDLASRVKSLPAVAVEEPDDVVLKAVLIKLLSDRQLRVRPNVVTYLAARMTRSFDAAARIVAALDQEALADRRRITVSMAGEILEKLEPIA